MDAVTDPYRPTPEDARSNAWKVHDAQVQWTSQVDAKAAFVLAIESGLLAGIVTLSGDNHRLTDLDDDFTRYSYMLGMAFVVAALICVAWVVRPRLRKTDMSKEPDENADYIYFGHAQAWSPEKLASTFERGDILPAISRQIVRMADIAWKKHVALQWSITCAVIGTSIVGLAAWTN